MKKKILLAIIFGFIFFNSIKAQIVLDTIFPGYDLVRLEKSGFKWMTWDASHTMTFLNMDYSLWKQFTFQADTGNFYIFYVSEILFDNDSTDLEFLLQYNIWPNSYRYIKIWDETGNLLFYHDNASVIPGIVSPVSPNVMSSGITNTDSAAIMVLRTTAQPYVMEIYKLPGYMACGACIDPYFKGFALGTDPDQRRQGNFINAYPNPSSDKTIIEYELPLSYQQGIMRIIDMNGNIVRVYKLSRQSKKITVEKGVLAPGMYTCIVEAGEQMVSKKFIRID